jgi:protein-arginine kinase
MGASTPAIEKLRSLCGVGDDDVDATSRISIATINRLFMLTLPAHLQLNYGKPLDPTHRDALRAEIIRSALNQDTPRKS